MPAPGEPDSDPAAIIATRRPVQVHTEGHWVGGTVLAWHRDHRGYQT